jgi:NAD(P)-dependent dehydrogenase (short-subunit alcohol dehydrogenase family)
MSVSVTRGLVEATGDYIVAGIPSARMGTPEDVAGTALYLASRAGAYVNGATITLDGGTGQYCLLHLDFIDFISRDVG